jgi:Type IV secretion system pilin
MKYFLPFAILILLVFVVPTDVVMAADGGPGNFVPCNGPDCSTCHFVSMINEIIKWLFGMIAVLFAGLMLVAGFGLVTSGGNPSALSAAKSKFVNAIIGIIIVLSAYLIIDTLMRGLLKGGDGTLEGFGPWSQVQCYTQKVPQPWSRSGRDGVVAGVVTPPDPTIPSGSLAHAAAVAQLGDGFEISSSGDCSDKTNSKCTSLDGVKDLTIQRIKELQQAVGEELMITGGTEDGHADGTYSHWNGYKIDLRPEEKLNSYITSNYESVGGSKWKDGNGNVYYRHGPPDHWDITVTR